MRSSLPELCSEARTRRRQGADVSVLAAGLRRVPSAPVGVAGSRAAPSRSRAGSRHPLSREPSSRSRHRSGSLRTARHEPTRAQLTTGSSAAAADHKRGLRRLCLGYPTAEPGDVAAAAVSCSALLAGAHSRTSSPARASRRTRRNRQVPEDESLAPGMVIRGETRTARMRGSGREVDAVLAALRASQRQPQRVLRRGTRSPIRLAVAECLNPKEGVCRRRSAAVASRRGGLPIGSMLNALAGARGAGGPQPGSRTLVWRHVDRSRSCASHCSMTSLQRGASLGHRAATEERMLAISSRSAKGKTSSIMSATSTFASSSPRSQRRCAL